MTLWRVLRQYAVKLVAAILGVPLWQVCGHRGLTYDVDEAWAINAAAAMNHLHYSTEFFDGWEDADVEFAVLNAIRSARPD